MDALFRLSSHSECKPRWQAAGSLAVMLLLTLAACAPSPAAPVEAVTEAPTVAPTRTATVLPSPTATRTQAPTATPLPTATATPEPTPTQPVGRQGLIAFVMGENWNGIHLINADGSGDPVTLSLHPSYDIAPSWSPDGSQIAFESFRDDPVEQKYLDIYTMNADGSGLTRLTNTDAFYTRPDWSPDGSQIALASDKEEQGNSDLYMLNIKTKELTRLTDDPAGDSEPSWSPDGSMIAFTSDRDGAPNVYTMVVETGETTQLTHDSAMTAQPDWSPDGEKILFVSNREGNAEIYIMDADGANPVRLTNTPGKDIHPEWSPDGKYFAYAYEQAEARSIYVADLNGSPPELLLEDTGGWPAWSVAEATFTEDPVIGPPFCARDADGDGKPDMLSTTFSTQDDAGFILFPYDNMQDGMDFWYSMSIPGEISMVGENHPGWDGGESGIHTTFVVLQHSPGVVAVEFYLGEKLIQEIECEVVEP